MNENPKNMARFLLLLAPLLCIPACSGRLSEPIELFNGRDLTGWTVMAVPADQNETWWSVVDGVIEANSMGRPDHDQVWLMHEAEFDDFELNLQFQAFRDSPGNSGIQVRSRYDAGPDAPRGGYLDGPQVDIHPPTPWRTGMIYDETRGVQRWVDPSLPDWRMPDSLKPADWLFHFSDEGEGWNDLKIICRGTRITSILNGIVMRDFDGTGILDSEAHRVRKVGLSGHIALQLHVGDETRIRFRNIRVTPFDGK